VGFIFWSLRWDGHITRKIKRAYVVIHKRAG
jgi:hypothetical protein